MAINQNHQFEELEGVKCAVVEKNVSKSRVEFLQRILAYNGYNVVVVPTPPPKAAPPKTAAPPADSDVQEVPATEASFVVGVTDVMFNPVNAIYGRLLKLPDGHVVTLAYWQQKETRSHDDIPYFNKPEGNQDQDTAV
jgi:hypothetical protein